MEARARAKAQLSALAIIVAFGVVLGLVADDSAAPTTAAEQASAKLDPEALARISVRVEPRVARRVEAIRELRFDEIPEPEVVDSQYLNRLSAREARRTDAVRGLNADEAELRILGLLKPGEELESIFGSTGDLAAAAYDTRKDRLYVVSDAVVASRALVEFVLAHELGHALEDQRFGLGAGGRIDDDAALARMALHEGSATALMISYAGEHLSATELFSASAGLGGETGDVPKFYVDQLLWTYMGGNRFVSDLRRLGGGWKLVDHALDSQPPATTEQVLHVEAYVRNEPAQTVRIGDRALGARGWRRADAGVIGELTTSQLLELGSARGVAARAAAGWGGDRYELWRRDGSFVDCEDPCRDELTLALSWRMDDEEEAAELSDALVGYLEDGLGGVAEDGGGWTLDGGVAALRSTGDAVALVFAPDEETATAVAEEQIAP